MEGIEKIPLFDNHSHELDYEKCIYTPTELSISYLHGFRDVERDAGGVEDWVSEELAFDLENFGVVKTMVCHLSKRFGCEASLSEVTARRNQMTKEGQWDYATELYREQNIVGTMVDSGLPMGDGRTRFPCRVFRLYRMDPMLEQLYLTCTTYTDLKREFLEKISAAIEEGYAGIKCHIGELFSLAVYPVTEYEAEKAFPSFLMGDEKASEIIYFALFSELMKLCGEKDTPIHVHTGCSGGSGNGKIRNLDPFLMAPYLNSREHQRTKLVFLHVSYPYIRNAALMTHMFPNVWMDLSWVLPWTSVDFSSILRAVLGAALHSRIMVGTGQHGIPEMAWISAKIIRKSLSDILDHAVEQELLTKEQAYETAEMILYGNAARMYRL